MNLLLEIRINTILKLRFEIFNLKLLFMAWGWGWEREREKIGILFWGMAARVGVLLVKLGGAGSIPVISNKRKQSGQFGGLKWKR